MLQGDNFPKHKATKHNNDLRVQPLILTDNKQRKLSFHKADQEQVTSRASTLSVSSIILSSRVGMLLPRLEWKLRWEEGESGKSGRVQWEEGVCC